MLTNLKIFDQMPFMSKCLKCLRPEKACICDYVTKVTTRTKFVILTHPKEFKKTKNGTGRMTFLSLTNAEIIVDVDFSENKRVNEIIEENHAMILYPGNKVFNCSKEKFTSEFTSGKELALFILDATWPCAKKMMKLSKNLHSLAKMSFDITAPSEFVIKQQPGEYCLSTIEATLKVLENLNDGYENISKESLKLFLRPFREMIKFQIDCANNPNLQGYRKKAYTPPSERKKSKKYNSKRLVFRND
jgi:DTW domain-containing protein YfiP